MANEWGWQVPALPRVIYLPSCEQFTHGLTGAQQRRGCEPKMNIFRKPLEAAPLYTPLLLARAFGTSVALIHPNSGIETRTCWDNNR